MELLLGGAHSRAVSGTSPARKARMQSFAAALQVERGLQGLHVLYPGRAVVLVAVVSEAGEDTQGLAEVFQGVEGRPMGAPPTTLKLRWMCDGAATLLW